VAIASNVRAGRATAFLAAFQPAKGTAVSDFTTAGAIRLWTESAQLPLARRYGLEAFMDSDRVPHEGARFRRPEDLTGRAAVLATPESLEWLLRSNYGPFAAGAFSLHTQVADDRWLTLGWVENVAGGTQNFVRLVDAWFHSLELVAEGPAGRVIALSDFAARSSLVQALNAGGVTLPVAPMAPADLGVFPVYGAQLFRDPTGDNEELRFRQLRLRLDQRLGYEWDMGAFKRDVFKMGKLRATLEFTSDVGDETWQALSNQRAGTDDRYRVRLTAGASVFTVDLHNVMLEVEALGHEGLSYAEFRAAGVAARDAGGNFLTVTLT